MKRLAELLGALAAAPHVAARAAWLDEYLTAAPDPDRGWGVGWMLGAVEAPRLGPAKLRALAETRVDAEMLRLSTAALGDVGEAVALIWPGAGDAPPGEILTGLHRPDRAFDRLDAAPRVALARLLAGRKPKGARFAELTAALARLCDAPPDLVAAGLAAEAPPYPQLFSWLRGEGPPPQAAPRPPAITRIPSDEQPEGARADYQVWPLPQGEPVTIAGGQAIGADGQAKTAPENALGWGFLDAAGFAPAPPAAPPLSVDWDAARAAHPHLLLLRDGVWSIWSAPPRHLICPVTFIALERRVELTLGVLVGEDLAPLVKLPSPAAEATEVAGFARREALDKFGPVRQVAPGLWAEIAFVGWTKAPRRKTKIALSGAEITRLIWTEPHPTPSLDEVLAGPTC